MTKRLLLASLLACAGLLGSTRAARADTLWWTASAGDDAASRAMNWKTHPSHVRRLPAGDLDVYVTTADHHGIRPGDLDVWPRITDADLVSGGLYVGGWPRSLRRDFGDPEAHSGRLHIAGGSLRTAEREGSPPCAYLRVGYDGADGHVEQSGGAFSSCTFLSLGFRRGTSFGSYELRGGEIDAFGLDTGVMGGGSLRQTGGELDAGTHNVGRGYTLGREFSPGSGHFRLGGGTHAVNTLRLGSRSGAAGLASVQRGTLSADAVEIGSEGSGALVQSGGRIVAKKVVVGHAEGGSGQLTVAGGELRVTAHLSVGDEAGGTGRATVTAGADITTARLTVHERSSLQFVGDARGIGRIVSSGPVEFREGSRVDVHVAGTNEAEPAPSLQLGLGQRLALVEASRVSGRPRLSEAAAAEWRLDVHAGGVDAIFYPCDLRCDLDHDGGVGIRDVTLMGSPSAPRQDCDGDGRNTLYDVIVLHAEYGQRCSD